MFEGFSPRTVDFMVGLSLNNEKVWFEAHRAEYERDFLLPMKALGRAVYEKVSSNHEDHGFIHKVSRIYKDARYLRAGEGPYRTSLWFSIEKPRLGAEWTDTPVFWFDLSAEGWSYGMGYGGAKSATMAKLRARIDEDPKRFEKLVAFLDGQKEFVLEGEDYVRKKEIPSVKVADWYNKKSFSLIHRDDIGEELYRPDLVERVAGGMLSLMPIYGYLVELDEGRTVK